MSHPESRPSRNRHERLKRQVLRRDGGVCSHCGWHPDLPLEPLNMLTLDHIVPLSSGGTNDPTNLRILCMMCNTIANRVHQSPRKLGQWDERAGRYRAAPTVP